MLILKKKWGKKSSLVTSSLEDAREGIHLFWKQKNKEKEQSILFCLLVQTAPQQGPIADEEKYLFSENF